MRNGGAALGVALAIALPAAAQTIQGPGGPVTVPGAELPGRIERQFEPPPSVAPVLPPLTPAAPAAPVRPKGGLQFVLKKVVVTGSSVYTDDELRTAYAPFLDQTMTVETLPQLEEAISSLYRRDGYILSRAVVEAQTIDPNEGVVHVKVLEGYIDRVRLDPLEYEVGDKGPLLRSILRHIEHACLPGETPPEGRPCPLHRDMLERYLLLANDLPGVKVTSVIQPATEAEGGADLFVTVDETPAEASVGIDNRGSNSVGPLTAHQSLALNDLLGRFDRTELRTTESIPFNELSLVNGVEEIPLTSNGLRLSIDYTHTRSRPGDFLRQLNLSTIGDAGGIQLSYPVMRTRSENLNLRAGFEARNAVTTHGVTDSTAFYDRTRSLVLGASYDLADRLFGVNLVDASLEQGLPILGATPRTSAFASHSGASPSFTKWQGEASREQEIVRRWNLLVGVMGQYSYSKLLSAEQFSYGGERYGRGYDASELLGDRGIAGKAELQYTPDWAPGMFGWEGGVQSLQFYGFYDFGRAWVDPGPSTHLSAASAGFGVRFTITEYFAGYLEVAKPLTRPVQALVIDGNTGKAPRFFFSVAAKF